MVFLGRGKLWKYGSYYYDLHKEYTITSPWLMETRLLQLYVLAHLLVNTCLTFLAAFSTKPEYIIYCKMIF